MPPHVVEHRPTGIAARLGGGVRLLRSVPPSRVLADLIGGIVAGASSGL
jgi:hypothetical protein